MTRPPTDDALLVAAAFRHLAFETDVDGANVIPEFSAEPIAVRGDSDDLRSRTQAQIIVRERISRGERQQLRSMGMGWLDLSGHLFFRSPQLIIDADVPAQPHNLPQRSISVLGGDVVSGVTMLALAYWPEPLPGVRPTARLINSSPGGASLAIRRLVDAGLLTADHRATAGLFWSAAAEWRPSWTRLPLDALPPDTARVTVGAHTASRLGAPIILSEDAEPEFLVTSQAALTYASMAANSRSDGHSDQTGLFALSPAAIIVEAINPDAPIVQGAPIAAEAIVALSLAIDPARGAETVRNWQGDHVW